MSPDAFQGNVAPIRYATGSADIVIPFGGGDGVDVPVTHNLRTTDYRAFAYNIVDGSGQQIMAEVLDKGINNVTFSLFVLNGVYVGFQHLKFDWMVIQ